MRSTAGRRATGRGGLVLAAACLLAACTGGDDRPAEATAATSAVPGAETPSIENGATTDRAADGATTGRPLRWVAIGDSYSAGMGGSLAGVQRLASGCLRAEPDSYARRAERLLDTGDEPAVELTVAACGGALVGDLGGQLDAAGVPAAGAGDGPGEGAGVGAPDLVTLTIGGNDAGFFDLTSRCLAGDCPDLAAEDAQLALVGDSTDGRRDWQVLTDALAEHFGAVLERLRPGGRLAVLTYPLPFPQQQGACPTGFAFLAPDDAAVVNAAITRLDDAVAEAARRAGQDGEGGRRVVVLEWRSPDGVPPALELVAGDGTVRRYGWNPAGICGVDPMLNGLNFQAEVADSFHPSDRGLDLAAALVAEAVRDQRDGG